MLKIQSALLLSLFLFINLHLLNAQWIQTNGPSGGEFHSIGIAGNIIFTNANKQLFRSTDNGDNWNYVNNSNLVEVIAYANIGNTLFVATQSKGVFRSTDNGVSWVKPDSNLSNYSLYDLAAIGNNLYACSVNNAINYGGIFLSTNFGDSWVRLGSVKLYNSFHVLAVIGTKIFAGTESNGIYISNDYGKSWITYGDSFRYNIIYSLAVDSTIKNSPILYAGTQNGVYTSMDYGKSWAKSGSQSNSFPINSLSVVKKDDGNTVILAGAFQFGIMISTDRGENWYRDNSGRMISTGTDFAVKPGANGGSIIFSSDYYSIYRSSDYGSSWIQIGKGIKNSVPVNLFVHKNVSGGSDLYASDKKTGIFLSTNEGEDWSSISSQLQSQYLKSRLLNISKDGLKIYAAGYGYYDIPERVYLSTNMGSSWNQIQDQSISICKLVADGDNFIATAPPLGINLLTNDCRNFTYLGLKDSSCYYLAILNKDGVKYILSCSFDPYNTLYCSSNNGTSWTSTRMPRCQEKDFLETDGTDLYASIWVPSSYYSSEVFLSTDLGNTWKSTNLSLDYYKAICFLAVPGVNNTNQILVGTENGVFLLNKDKTGWTPFGLTGQIVNTLALNNNYIFAGVDSKNIGENNGGVWKRPLKDVTTSICKQPFELTAKLKLSQNYPNPFNPTTIIEFVIPKESYVTLKVFNILGEEVATLAERVLPAGTHSVAFNAARLPSGIYAYKIQTENFEQVKKMMLIK